MPSTFSNLGLELQATGENANTWGQKTNVGLQRVDNAIAGYTTVQANSTTITLAFSTNSGSTTFTDENGRNKILKFTSGTAAAAITVTVPDIEKEYLVRNETGQNVTFSAGGSTTITLATGKNAHIYIDGASAVYNSLADIVTTSLETGGITTTGDINLGDNDKINVGASNDLQIYHNATNSVIDEQGTGQLLVRSNGDGIFFQNGNSTASLANFRVGTGNEFYYNGDIKLETTAGGAKVTGTLDVTGQEININGTAAENIIDFASTDMRLRWLNSTPAFETILKASQNGSTELYYDGSKKIETTTNGITVTGSVLATTSFAGDDNVKLQLGNSGDFQIYHNGTSNYVLGTTPRSVIIGSDNTTAVTIDTAQNAIFDYGVLANEGTLTDGATISWDVNTTPVAKVTLGGNRTISAPSNQAGSGQFISILVIQDGTGSRTLSWNAAYEFKDDTAPTLTTTGGKGDLFVFRYYGTGSKWVEVGRNLNLSLS